MSIDNLWILDIQSFSRHFVEKPRFYVGVVLLELGIKYLGPWQSFSGFPLIEWTIIAKDIRIRISHAKEDHVMAKFILLLNKGKKPIKDIEPF